MADASLPAPIRPSAAEVSARIAAMPIVAEARAAHALGLPILALPPPATRPLPREAARLAPTPPRILENTPMITPDNPPSRKRSAAARAVEGRS